MDGDIIVQRLLSAYNPYKALGLHPRDVVDLFDYNVVDQYTPREERINAQGDIAWHFGRIRYFVELIAHGEKLDPIEIDERWHRCGPLGPDLIDGHHRLCAADFAGVERIPASLGGTMDMINWLTGKTHRRPEHF